jgi:hypothetical protein
MAKSLIGLYAVPKTGKLAGTVMLAVKYDDSKVTLLDVKSNRKITLNRSNVVRFKKDGKTFQAHKTSYNGAEYLVTVKGTIVSLTTNRVMKWSEDNGNTVAIKTKAYLESELSGN